MKAEEELTPSEERGYNAPMDPLKRFLILLIALLIFFVALYFLSGVYYVQKGKRQLLLKKNHYEKTLKPGLYFFLPILYEGFGQYYEGEHAYRVHLGHRRITFLGSLSDPAAFCAGKKSYRSWIKKAIKENPDAESLSLQIEALLSQNGWKIASVLIER